VDTNDSQSQGSSDQSAGEAGAPPATTPGRGIRDIASSVARRLRRRPVPQILALLVIAALVGSAYVVAAPPNGDGHTQTTLGSLPGAGPVLAPDANSYSSGVNGTTTQEQTGRMAVNPMPAATAGPAADTKTTTVDGVTLAALDTSQIVKTGSLALEVGNIDQALTQATVIVKGLGGRVSDSSRSNNGYAKDPNGTDSANVVATLTFRIPSDKWDDAITALHGVGSRIVSENTNTTDVTTQVIDVDARIANLRKTETALQSVMAQATKVDDILAIQKELTATRGDIEQLTAESTHLKDQASMSTLSVTFTLPGKTVTVQATEGWSLGAQVDQAGAALVRVGQGLATIAVWAVVVILPIGLAILILLALAAIVRRMMGRGRKNATASA